MKVIEQCSFNGSIVIWVFFKMVMITEKIQSVNFARNTLNELSSDHPDQSTILSKDSSQESKRVIGLPNKEGSNCKRAKVCWLFWKWSKPLTVAALAGGRQQALLQFLPGNWKLEPFCCEFWECPGMLARLFENDKSFYCLVELLFSKSVLSI